MIKEISFNELKEVVDFSWDKAQVNSQSSFPKFKSYEDMYSIFEKGIKHKDNKVLAYYKDDQLEGILGLIIDNESKWIQANGGIFVRDGHEIVAAEFLGYLMAIHPGYEILFGYPVENEEAIDYLRKIGAELIEASLVMELERDSFNYNEEDNTPRVKRLEPKYYQQFATLHDACNPDVYWNSERILEKIDLWDIFIILHDEEIVGSINIRPYQNNAEIFAVSVNPLYNGKGFEAALISQSLRILLDKGVEYVLYFVEKGHIYEEEAALSCGFRVKDDYVLYRINRKK